MKLSTIIPLLLTTLVAAAPAPQEDHSGHGTTTPGTGGLAGQDGTIPAGVVLEPDLKRGAPNTVTHRYGPYQLGGMKMITNRPVLSVKRPCTGTCYITALQAGLEYADGKEANVNTGGWLHHMMLSISGSGRKDLVCGGSGIMSLMGQRTYASGNERTVMRTNKSGNYGLKLATNDRMSMIVDLMNEMSTSQTFYLTMTYEYTTQPQQEVQVAWLDIAGCMSGSEVPAKEGVYDITSKPWTSSVSGPLLYATGHVHDGGMYTTIQLNGKTVCKSTQLYGRTPQYIAPGGGHGGHKKRDGGAGAHISDAGICVNFGTIKRGDTLTVTAHYDTNKYPLMDGHDGGKEAIMGISRVLIGSSPSSTGGSSGGLFGGSLFGGLRGN